MPTHTRKQPYYIIQDANPNNAEPVYFKSAYAGAKNGDLLFTADINQAQLFDAKRNAFNMIPRIKGLCEDKIELTLLQCKVQKTSKVMEVENTIENAHEYIMDASGDYQLPTPEILTRLEKQKETSFALDLPY